MPGPMVTMQKSSWPMGVSDPYFAWGVATNYAGYQSVSTLLVVFEGPILPVKTLDALTTAWSAFTTSAASNGATIIQLHPHWLSDEYVFYGTATVNASGLVLLRTLCAAGLISRFEVGLEPADQRPRWKYVSPSVGICSAPEVLCDAEVLYGVVDYGCPLAHTKLRTTTGETRILNFWDQRPLGALSGALPPLHYGFGLATSAVEINRVLNPRLAANWDIDEAGFYSGIGHTELTSRASHGAHLLGLLFDEEISPSFWREKKDHAPARPKNLQNSTDRPDLVFVQLPATYQQGMPRSAFVANRLAAIRYIVGCAGATTKRIVVPISSENWDGSHDGNSLFEKALDALIEHTKREANVELQVLIAAGNGLRALAHQSSTMKTGVQAIFTVRILPGNEMPTLVEFWVPKVAAISSVEVLTPSKVSCISTDGSAGIWSPAPGPLSGPVAVIDQGDLINGMRCIVVRLAPTLSYDSGIVPADVGDWTIRVSTKDNQDIPVQGVIARSTHGLGGQRRSYQSYFPDPTANESLTPPQLDRLPARGLGTVNGLANGKNLVSTVGGYRIFDTTRANYSAAGPSNPGGRHITYSVDSAAPSEESPALFGLRSWGNCSGASIRLGGTSASTPLVARYVAVNGSMPPLPPPNTSSKADPQFDLGAFNIITPT